MTASETAKIAGYKSLLQMSARVALSPNQLNNIFNSDKKRFNALVKFGLYRHGTHDEKPESVKKKKARVKSNWFFKNLARKL